FRVRVVYYPGIAETRALERSIARKSGNPTRRDGPPLGNRETSRAGEVHRSKNAEFHAREWTTAQQSQRLTRGSSPALRKDRIPRAGPGHRAGIADAHVLS